MPDVTDMINHLDLYDFWSMVSDNITEDQIRMLKHNVESADQTNNPEDFRYYKQNIGAVIMRVFHDLVDEEKKRLETESEADPDWRDEARETDTRDRIADMKGG